MATWYVASIVLGLVLGAVVWPLLRTVPGLARWLCRPFGPPGSVASVVALLVALGAVFVAIVVVFSTTFSLFIESHVADPAMVGPRGVLRQYFLASSLVGCVFVGLVIRLESGVRGRLGPKHGKRHMSKHPDDDDSA